MVLLEDTTKTLGGQGPKVLNNKAEEKMEKQAVEMSQPLHKKEEISKEQSKKAPIKSLEDRPNFASLVTQETLGKQKDTQPKANEPKKCFFGSGDTHGEEDDTYGIGDFTHHVKKVWVKKQIEIQKVQEKERPRGQDLGWKASKFQRKQPRFVFIQVPKEPNKLQVDHHKEFSGRITRSQKRREQRKRLAKKIAIQLEGQMAMPKSTKKESLNSEMVEERAGGNKFVSGIKVNYLVKNFNSFHIRTNQLITLVSLLLSYLVLLLSFLLFFENVYTKEDCPKVKLRKKTLNQTLGTDRSMPGTVNQTPGMDKSMSGMVKQTPGTKPKDDQEKPTKHLKSLIEPLISPVMQEING